MRKRIRLLTALTILLLFGCSGDNGESESATRATAPVNTSRVSTENVFSSQVQALEQAEQVDRMVLEHKRAIDARLQ